jgi:hypothetical protein
MKAAELRALIRESAAKPIRVCMDDGRQFTISHPDFGMVADGALIVGSGPGHELGETSFAVCWFDHITRVEVLKKRAKAA